MEGFIVYSYVLSSEKIKVWSVKWPNIMSLYNQASILCAVSILYNRIKTSEVRPAIYYKQTQNPNNNKKKSH